MALEDTYFSMAEKCGQNVLIIADRGVMDASAFIDREAWERILAKLSLEDIEISDNRYNHVVHMQVQPWGSHSGTAMWFSFRYYHVVHMQVQPWGSHSGTAMWFTCRYYHVVHMQVQPCGSHSGTTMWFTCRYSHGVLIQVQPFGSHAGTTMWFTCR